MKVKYLTVMISIITMLFAAACSKQETPTSNSSASSTSSASISDGELLYKKSCIACHGNNLEGGVGPKLQKIGSKLSVDQIKNQIVNGRGGMPAGILKDEDAQKVAVWLAKHK
ncbi:cytochrome c551 [Paenibacillus sp. V4I3]|uniref:cytochrome c551 n=1 Tax=unclassified Paenibacillus TaxID=185978 RepID=UPI0027835203|nr:MULTISPECIES: cytochrome c [unclassified Paenibacillus]MDQ0877620.1 cytochrome c551 [Paenibacillus sp. V4I3]MDQ0886507.1 cytochrome c551 [Paenibacillus sp. V4I9]